MIPSQPLISSSCCTHFIFLLSATNISRSLASEVFTTASIKMKEVVWKERGIFIPSSPDTDKRSFNLSRRVLRPIDLQEGLKLGSSGGRRWPRVRRFESSWGFHFRLLLFPSISFLLKIRRCFEANFMFWNTNQLIYTYFERDYW